MSPVTAVAPAAAQPGTHTARGFEVAMTPHPARPAQARRITGAHMQLWRIASSTAGDVALVVSELVTNALQHGEGAIGLRVRYGDGLLRIEVTDESPVPAQPRRASDEDLSGRGLLLVDQVSKAWGSDGHTTWAEFDAPAGDLAC